MPAAKLTPIDREHVKATYIATAGDATETGKRHGLTRSHVKTLAHRFAWPARPRKAVTDAVAAVTNARAVILHRRPDAVTAVTTTSGDAMLAMMQEKGRSTKLSLATAAQRKAADLAQTDPAEVDAGQIKQTAQAASILHDWQRQDTSATAIFVHLGLGRITLDDKPAIEQPAD